MHGDSSIYGALTKLSKDWVMGIPLVEMQGNNGSIDGDVQASMRYTEAKLTKFSEDILLSNLALDGIIPQRLNFDDTVFEPEYLPAKLPNILINGSEGIGVGFASNVPPFNIQEVIDACVVELERPTIEDNELLTYVPMPDFPTGGTIAGYKDFSDSLLEGKGNIRVRGNYTISEDTKNKEITITFNEIPYGCIKPQVIQRVREDIENREISGIKEIQDNSNSQGVELDIICSDSANIDGILAYLFTKTNLQMNYSLNATMIVNNKPKTVGVPRIIREFNKFRLETYVKGLKIQIEEFEARKHLNEGYVLMVDNIEQVIAIIKESDSKKDAHTKLREAIGFSEIQANKILDMSLHRINKSDKQGFVQAVAECTKQIDFRKQILSSEQTIREAVIQAYKGLKEKYPYARKTVLKEEQENWVFSPESVIPKEKMAVGISEDGYIKVSNFRSYKSSNADNSDWKYVFETDNLQNLVVVTSSGEAIYIPVHQLPLVRWSDGEKHFSALKINIGTDKIAFADVYDGEDKNKEMFLIKNSGVVKKSDMFEYVKTRGYFSTQKGIKLKPNEEVIGGFTLDKDETYYVALMDSTQANMFFNTDDVSTASRTAQGMMGMKPKKNAQITEFALYSSKDDIPDYCQEKARGATGFNRKKNDPEVHFKDWVKPVSEDESQESE